MTNCKSLFLSGYFDSKIYGFVATETLLVDRRSRILWNDEESL